MLAIVVIMQMNWSFHFKLVAMMMEEISLLSETTAAPTIPHVWSNEGTQGS
jgi:hypothetical protein